MQTLTIDGPGKYSFAERPIPTPQPGEVLLRLRRLGWCGTDLSTWRGANPLIAYPRIPGHEIAAVIEAVTRGVPDSLPPGLEVTVLPYTQCGKCTACRQGRVNTCRHNQTLGVQRDGAFMEFISMPWQKVVPAKLSLRELALVEPLAVGFHAVGRGRVTRNDTVMVFGCGMIGLGVIAGAGLGRGATVIAVDIDDGKFAIAKKAGATHTINSRTENLHDRLQALTNGDGPDVVVEAVGTPGTFIAAVDEVCTAGRVVYIGYAKSEVSYQTPKFIVKELDILGSRNSTPDDFRDVITMLEAKRYPVDQTITRTVPFAEAGDAMAQWAANPAVVTKIHVEL